MAEVQVGVIMGSSSDWDTMQHAVAVLQEFGVAFEARVVSAHRMPDDMFAYAESAADRGLQAIIAGAGEVLSPGGWLLLEHGYDQAVKLRTCLKNAGFGQVASWQDAAGIERVSGGVWGSAAG